jgi:hypothetical protein
VLGSRKDKKTLNEEWAPVAVNRTCLNTLLAIHMVALCLLDKFSMLYNCFFGLVQKYWFACFQWSCCSAFPAVLYLDLNGVLEIVSNCCFLAPD